MDTAAQQGKQEDIRQSHRHLVHKLMKPGNAMMRQIDADRLELLHMAVGVSGEAGELLDAVKKHVIYNQRLDRENVVEELGDLMFYIEGMRQVLNMDPDEPLRHNQRKLMKRYGEKYSDEAAHQRVDKDGEQ